MSGEQSAARESRWAAVAKPPGRKKIDPNAPKRGMSAYTCFANENRDRVRETDPGIKFGEVGKVLGEKWKSLTEEERKPYEELAARDKIRYHKELAKYEIKLDEGEAGSSKKSESDQESKFAELFAERPPGLLAKSAWLRKLEKEHGKTWYDQFFLWHTNRLYRPPPPWYNDKLEDILHIINLGPQVSWHPNDLSLQSLTHYLSHRPVSSTPDLYVGRYNDYSIGLVLNGAALHPRQVGVEVFQSLNVSYAHLPMFAGLRTEESKDDLCVLTLGNLYALRNEVLSEGDNWFDTDFVFALDITNGWRKNEFLLIYKYGDVDNESLDDHSEESSEEPQHEYPPHFCNGPDAFTVATCETGSDLSLKRHEKSEPDVLATDTSTLFEIKLAVGSVKKLDFVVAGYVNDENSYVPVIPPMEG